MAGLYHDFLVVESGTFSLDYHKTYQGMERVTIHDDLLRYFSDSIAWIPSLNPCTNEQAFGLCWYGPTIFSGQGASKLRRIVSGWLLVLSEAPDVVTLRGGWCWVEGDPSETGAYEELSFCRSELLDKLGKLVSFCEIVEASDSSKSLLHLGI